MTFRELPGEKPWYLQARRQHPCRQAYRECSEVNLPWEVFAPDNIAGDSAMCSDLCCKQSNGTINRGEQHGEYTEIDTARGKMHAGQARWIKPRKRKGYQDLEERDLLLYHSPNGLSLGWLRVSS